MSSSFIKQITGFLRKKLDLSFLIPGSVLVLTGIVITALHTKQVFQNELGQSKTLIVRTSMPHGLTHIKPFTSLVGFNWKFAKENKRKTRESKITTFWFSIN